MASHRYSLLCGRVLDKRKEVGGKSPHYQILIEGGNELFRVAVNTRSGSSKGREADLLYFADNDFRHQITDRLDNVEPGVREVASKAHGLALDYQRGGLFDRRHMRRIPASRPGPSNDLADELDYHVNMSIRSSAMRLYVYGTRWGPETTSPDQVFGFAPGNGIHDVHMNQGNRDEHWHDNHAWADGGLLFHEPEKDRWSAIFLAFQSQSWHTDEHGDPIDRKNARS